VTSLDAGRKRADVDATWGSGGSHGFAGTVRAAVGKHTVCAVVHNTGSGADRRASPCRTVTVR